MSVQTSTGGLLFLFMVVHCLAIAFCIISSGTKSWIAEMWPREDKCGDGLEFSLQHRERSAKFYRVEEHCEISCTGMKEHHQFNNEMLH